MSKSTLARITMLAVIAFTSAFGLFSTVITAIEPGDKPILITDDCEPVSFNIAFPGSCMGNGNTTFEKFIGQLTKHQNAFLWMFSPRDSTVPVGKTLSLGNTGGETHTFTKVAEFGGGFIIPLNALSGNLVPRPECTTGMVLVPGTILEPQPPSASNIFVAAGEQEAGPTAGDAVLPSGQTVKFMCCLHPWMRTELRVK